MSLSPEKRAEYDHWLQKVPSGGAEEALWNLMRLQVEHDTAGLRTAVDGWPQLLDAADERMRDLVGEARALRLTADGIRAEVAAVRADVAALRADVSVVRGELDDETELRADLEDRVARVALTVALLCIIVLALAAEAVSRYWGG